jgi:hypothetical protein
MNLRSRGAGDTNEYHGTGYRNAQRTRSRRADCPLVRRREAQVV